MNYLEKVPNLSELFGFLGNVDSGNVIARERERERKRSKRKEMRNYVGF
jgi:hypothetical protein